MSARHGTSAPHSEAAPVLIIWVRMAACAAAFHRGLSHGCCSTTIQGALWGFFFGAWWESPPRNKGILDAEGQVRGHLQLLVWDPASAHQCCALRAWIKHHQGATMVNMSRLLKIKLSPWAEWKADWWLGWGGRQAGGGPVKAGAWRESGSRDRRSGCLAEKQREESCALADCEKRGWNREPEIQKRENRTAQEGAHL